MGPRPECSRSRPPTLSVRRVAALGVLAAVAALYVSPVQKYLRSARAAAGYQTPTGDAAAAQHDRLHPEAAALDTNERIILLARDCGWIFPGEHPLVIRDIPASAATQCG